MKIVAIVQARMTSTRLPGKVLAKVCGKPLLRHMIERLKRCETLDEIVIAIAEGRQNQPIAQLVADMILEEGWESTLGWVKGSELDVLGRVLHAAHQTKADLIVELTADCPLIDPLIVDEAVREFMRWRDDECLPAMDFVTNTQDVVSAQVAYPRGMDVRVFPTEVLERVDKLTNDPQDREHVSLYIWKHPADFQIRQIYAPEELRDDIRLTVDTPEDLELVKTILEEFLPHCPVFGLGDVLELLRYRPELREINRHVQQKVV